MVELRIDCNSFIYLILFYFGIIFAYELRVQ